MARITEKKLIETLPQLKEIKPRQEWVSLLKSQILTEKKIELAGDKVRFLDVLSSMFFQKKFAYSFAAFLFVIVGLVGFAKYTVPGDLLFPIKKISEQSQAALTRQPTIKQDVVALNNRINDLAQAAKDGKKSNIPSAISEINTNVSALTKTLKDSPTKDQETIKDIVNSLKVLANVPGTDLTESPEIIDLYKTVVENQIADLKESTLTSEQEKTLAETEELYKDGKYSEALEKILLIDK